MAKKAPDELNRKIEELSDDQLKDAIVRTCIRQGRAEADLAHYKETYGEVIKEEKELRASYLMALEVRTEAARRREVAEGVLADADGVDEITKAEELLRLVKNTEAQVAQQ
jgi:hypothetical protein